MTNTNTFNGWANYETWNVALWINNDEFLNELAQEAGNYETFIQLADGCNYFETADGVDLLNRNIDIEAINEIVFDFN